MQNCEWLILLAGVLIAAVAATAAWRSARAAEKTNLAQILMQLVDAYASEKMLASMRKLRNWKNECRKKNLDFAEEFAQKREPNDTYEEVRELDEARRRYSHHFHGIWLLFDCKLVNKNFIKGVVSCEQVEFLLEIIEPLEKAINPNYNRSRFDFFRGLYPQINESYLSEKSNKGS